MSRLLATLAAVFVLLGVGTAGAGAATLGAEPKTDLIGCAKDPVDCLKGGAGEIGDKADDLTDAACGALGVEEACDKVKDVAGGVTDTLSAPLKGLQKSLDALAAAVDAIASFSPSNMAEEWAKTAAEGVVWVLDQITTATNEIARPGYSMDWWAKQYAVTFALGLVALAFMLVFLGAKIGGPDTSVSGVTLAREVVGRLPWVVPMMVAAPAVMLVTQGMFAGFAEAIGKQGNDEAGSAADSFIELMGKMPSDGGYFAALGGGLMAMIMLGLGVMFGFLVLVELTFAQWGSNFFGLLVPIAIAMWIYPPWRKVLGGLAAFLVGIWLMPLAVNLVHWSMWSAAANGFDDDPLKTTLYVVVGMFMLAAAPFLAPMILMKMLPDYDGPGRGQGAPAGGGKPSSPRSGSSDVDRARALQSRQRGEGIGGGPGASGGPGKAAPAAGGPGGSTPGVASPAAGGPAAGGAGPALASGGGGGGAAAGGGGAAAGGAAAAGPVIGAAAMAATIAQKMRSDMQGARSRWTRG